MASNIYILNASGVFTPYSDELKKTIRAVITKIKKEIKLDNVDILIKTADDPALLKDLNGVGAYCPSAYFVQLSIDIDHPFFQKSPKKAIEKPLIHELHHAFRRLQGINIDKGSIWECIWSEGLADYFVYLLTGEMSKWVIPLDKKTKDYLLKKLAKEKNKKMTPEKYKEWFIEGNKKRKIGKWTGYVLGFELVKTYFDKNNTTIKDLSEEKAPNLSKILGD